MLIFHFYLLSSSHYKAFHENMTWQLKTAIYSKKMLKNHRNGLIRKTLIDKYKCKHTSHLVFLSNKMSHIQKIGHRFSVSRELT